MSNRIENAFEKCRNEHRKALILYVTAGFPDYAASEKLIDRLIASGADIIELGVPFSDPFADGPIIQHTGNIALENGASLAGILELAGRVRRNHPETPLVLFSYFNVLFSYGLEKLAAHAEAVGIDAILPVDVPLEERSELLPYCLKHDLALIPLLSPSTDCDRAAEIVKDMKGFVYCITVCGVTGVRDFLPPELKEELCQFKRLSSSLPVAAGFGISTPEMARKVGAEADAVVVGSAVMQIMLEAKSVDDGIEKCGEFAASLARSLHGIE